MTEGMLILKLAAIGVLLVALTRAASYKSDDWRRTAVMGVCAVIDFVAVIYLFIRWIVPYITAAV